MTVVNDGNDADWLAHDQAIQDQHERELAAAEKRGYRKGVEAAVEALESTQDKLDAVPCEYNSAALRRGFEAAVSVCLINVRQLLTVPPEPDALDARTLAEVKRRLDVLWSGMAANDGVGVSKAIDEVEAMERGERIVLTVPARRA